MKQYHRYILALVMTGPLLLSLTPQPVQAVARPKIKVGLYETTDAVTVTATGKSTIRTVTTNTKLHTLPTGETATINYDTTSGLYTVAIGDWSTTSVEPIKIDPPKNKITTITSYSNPPAWNAELNDNEYYGSIELNSGWVVNELGIENYVKGVAETSSGDPVAYYKTLYTAARTYAYYLYLYPNKYPGEPYLLTNTANDQVYRGYGFTKRSTDIAAAVDATAGNIVTYNNEVVVTPYFSQSDGRTRSWEEVWGGTSHPYLQSVADPCCSNDTLLGHGVGLSAGGALYYANHGYHWRDILAHYYQGIVIQQLW